MIKPILKIELSTKINMADFDKIVSQFSKEDSDIKKQYHVIILKGESEFSHVEIITASDISLHKD